MDQIDAITELSSKNFHLVRTSVYSFIQNNRWFTGKLYFIVHKDLHFSENNLDSIRSIYANIELLNCSSFLIVSNNRISIVDYSLSMIKNNFPDLQESNLLYFSNDCIFMKDISFLSFDKLKVHNYLFSSISQNYLADDTDQDTNDWLCLASNFKDSVFLKEKNSLSVFSVIVFDTFMKNTSNFTKINQIWLQCNHKTSQFLNNPKRFNYSLGKRVPGMKNKNSLKYKRANRIIGSNDLKKIELFTTLNNNGKSYVVYDDLALLSKNIKACASSSQNFEILFGFSRLSEEQTALLNNLHKIYPKLHSYQINENSTLDSLNKLISFCLYDNVFLIDSNGISSINKIISHDYSNILAIKKLKVGILTAAWKRPDLTAKYNQHINFLANEFKDIAEIVSVIVDSGGFNRKSSIENNALYYEYENLPLSDKFNFGMRKFKDLKVDAVMILGTDNFVDTNMFCHYLKAIRNKFDLVGALDSFIYDTLTDKSFHFIGYTNSRIGETLGAGRVLSANLLSKLNYSPWKDGISKGLDGSMWKKIKPLNVVEYKIHTSKHDFVLLGVKTDTFISDIKRFKNIVQIDKSPLKKIKSLSEYL